VSALSETLVQRTLDRLEASGETLSLEMRKRLDDLSAASEAVLLGQLAAAPVEADSLHLQARALNLASAGGSAALRAYRETMDELFANALVKTISILLI
jgi:hypothetical protein